MADWVHAVEIKCSRPANRLASFGAPCRAIEFHMQPLSRASYVVDQFGNDR
jgi:hypothetical protein